MLDYDDLAPRYVGICLICGEQVLKKKAVSIMYRAPTRRYGRLGTFAVVAGSNFWRETAFQSRERRST